MSGETELGIQHVRRDGNGHIDLIEMTKIVKAIYNMMGPNQVAMDQFESPEARAEGS